MKGLLRIIILTLILAFVSVFHAQIVQPFAIRYQTNQKGGLTFVANTALTCNPNTNGCNAAAGYTTESFVSNTYNNNNWTMQYVDMDGDGSTFMSSSDSLDLPQCSEISWAGLYWSASNTTPTSYTSALTQYNSAPYLGTVRINGSVAQNTFSGYNVGDQILITQTGGGTTNQSIEGIFTVVVANANYIVINVPWSTIVDVSTNGQVNKIPNGWANRTQCKFKVNNGAYQTLTADQIVNSTTGYLSYFCYKNVTSIVQAAGTKARFTLADMICWTGSSNFADAVDDPLL